MSLGAVQVRPSTSSDNDGLVDLATRVLDAGDQEPIHREWTSRLLGGEASSIHPEDIAVADHPRHGVVGAAWLLSQPLRVRGTAIKAGQVEQLAVDPRHRGAGIARALVDVLHERSSALGQLLTIARGVPWLYERLGYQAMLELPRLQVLSAVVIESERTISELIPARLEDAPELARLDANDDCWSVRRQRDEEEWSLEIGRPSGHPWRSVLSFAVDARARTLGVVGVLDRPGSPPVLHRLLVAPGGCPRSLLQAGLGPAQVDGTTRLLLPSAHRIRAVVPELPAPGPPRSWRVRVPDSIALLGAVAESATRVLATSSLAGWQGGVLVDRGKRLAASFSVDAGGRLTVSEQEEYPGTLDVRLPDCALVALALGHRGIDDLDACDGTVTVDDPTARVLLRHAFPPGGCDLWPLA